MMVVGVEDMVLAAVKFVDVWFLCGGDDVVGVPFKKYRNVIEVMASDFKCSNREVFMIGLALLL